MFHEQTAMETHVHDFVELVFVQGGSGTHLHDGHRYPVFAGDCFVVVPGQAHGYLDDRNLRIVNVLFYPTLLKPYRKELLAAPGFIQFFSIEPLFRSENAFRYKLHLNLAQQKTMETLCGQVYTELSDQSSAYRPMCSGLFVQMIVFLSRCFEDLVSAQEVRQEFDGKKQAVDAAIAYLEENYAGEVKLGDVARSAYLSPSRLCHVFKDATGMSLVDYLTRMRIDKACQMLTEDGESITEICYSLGFNNPTHFSRTFRKVTGRTPSAYRKAGGGARPGR